MSGWLDKYAKRSARASGQTQRGLSRRRVLGGSAAVIGAWSAPMLTSAPAHAYGVSTCPAGRGICGATTELQACCPGALGTGSNQYTCAKDGNGANVCVLNGNAGGICNGQGNCNGTVKCNGSSNSCKCGAPTEAAAAYPASICGGYGAKCDNAAECSPGFTCLGAAASNQKFCAPVCQAGTCGANLTCLSDVCRQTCTNSNQCPSGGCSGGFCTG